MEPADSESLDQRIYGLGAWLPPMPEPLPTLEEQPQTAAAPQGDIPPSNRQKPQHVVRPGHPARCCRKELTLCRRQTEPHASGGIV